MKRPRLHWSTLALNLLGDDIFVILLREIAARVVLALSISPSYKLLCLSQGAVCGAVGTLGETRDSFGPFRRLFPHKLYPTGEVGAQWSRFRACCLCCRNIHISHSWRAARCRDWLILGGMGAAPTPKLSASSDVTDGERGVSVM